MTPDKKQIEGEILLKAGSGTDGAGSGIMIEGIICKCGCPQLLSGLEGQTCQHCGEILSSLTTENQ